MLNHSIEVGGMNDHSLVHYSTYFFSTYFFSTFISLVEHAEDELQFAGQTKRVRAVVGKNQLLQRGHTPEQINHAIQESIGDVILQAYKEGSIH